MRKKKIGLLGDFQCIDSGGHPIKISLAKEIGVIAVLALAQDHSCARVKMIDLLWSDRCGEQGRSSLRHSLWSLKSKLNRESPRLLQSDRKRVSLDVDACVIDTCEFANLATSDRQEDLERAISIYRGDLLEDLVVHDREWEAWIGIQRSRLQMAYAECLYQLSIRYLAGRDVGKLIGTGLQLIAHNQLSEEGHRALMEAYSLAQQKSLALQQYERYRDMIHRELGCFPEPGLRQLYERIKSDRSPGDVGNASRRFG